MAASTGHDRARRRRIRRMGLAVAALVVLTSTAAPAGATLPPRSVRHQNSQYWVWFAPRNWTSVDSPYGITITSGNGAMTIDDGFSSILCAPGTTVQESVTNHFARMRSSVAASIRSSWRNPSFSRSPIRRLDRSVWGPLYFRQTFRASGVARGVPYSIAVRLDYSLATGPTYCYNRNVSFTAPSAGFDRSLDQLVSVHLSKAYSGPGLPPGPNGEPA